jgi:cation-transporting ATPase F
MKPPPSDPLQNLLGCHWHHLPAAEVGQLLETNLEAGLDLFQVTHRREHFGPNQITPREGRSPWMRFLLQFHTCRS